MLDLLKTNKAAGVSALGVSQETAPPKNGGLVYVPLRQILDNPYQQRTNYDAEHILNLAMSIKGMSGELPATKGLQQVPLARVGTVQEDGSVDIAAKADYGSGRAQLLLKEDGGVVQLMFGHSRLRAFMVIANGLRQLGRGEGIGMRFDGVSELQTRFGELWDADPDYEEMPIMLGFALDYAMWSHAITENSQRKNITAIEEAQSMQRAIEEFGLTAAEAGQPFGYARSTTANKLRLLQLPAEAVAAIADGRLTERHGRELVRLVDDPERLQAALDYALKRDWTVRQLASDVDWRERGMKEALALAAEAAAVKEALAKGWTLPGQTEPVPEACLMTERTWLYAFDMTDGKHQALIEQGHCGPHCECFRIGWCNSGASEGCRPDPDRAPHMAAACDDHWTSRSKKIDALSTVNETPEEIAAREERAQQLRQVEQLNNQAHTVWMAWCRQQDPSALWNSIELWREMAKYNAWLPELIQASDNTHDACLEVLILLYKRTRRYANELNSEVHYPHEVRALIGRLSGGKDD